MPCSTSDNSGVVLQIDRRRVHINFAPTHAPCSVVQHSLVIFHRRRRSPFAPSAAPVGEFFAPDAQGDLELRFTL
ncbi:Hypothetical predicted protein [Cloeon dipterum]|uniref:Uncharacterized protein n=1 Tax=Cloeon dipterum TaxID=197152 RepID=A0A8S1BT05_9INSE|nr:Hypothetical predicted protein [Cloeon dipterum]